METLSTLRFGTRAKSIKNKATVNEERSVGELKIIINKLQQELQRLRKYIATLEGELGIVKGGGKSTLASSLNEEAKKANIQHATSTPSLNQQPQNTSALKELHEQIEQLQNQIAKKEELLNVAEEAKNILMDQLSEKQIDLDQIQTEVDKFEEQINNHNKITEELEEEQKSLIAQIATKDIEIEQLQQLSKDQIIQNEELKQNNIKLKEEKILLTSQLQNIKQNKVKRKRSVSLQKINEEKDNWTQREEAIELNLSRSLQKFISPENLINSEDSSDLSQAITETRDHITEFREFQNALLEDWKHRSKIVSFKQKFSFNFFLFIVFFCFNS